jgi:NitT/TauT family transport system substrate-binding protein
VGGGVYEQTIQMAAEGQAVTSFVTLGRSPNFALLAATASAVKRPEDLRGKAVGVSSVGSPSQFYLNTVLRRHGIDPEDVSTVSVGMGAPAVVALDRGQVAAAVLFGSAITAVESRGATLLADSRTPMGLRDIFGIDDYPASSLLARSDWLRANPEQARKLARAVLKAIAWIQDHSAEDVLARVPAEFRVGDQTVELAAIRLAQPMYSRDGRVRTESAEAVRKVLASSLDAVRIEGIRLDRTYTNSLLP